MNTTDKKVVTITGRIVDPKKIPLWFLTRTGVVRVPKD
jgi:RNase P/RNase MRP subunit p29